MRRDDGESFEVETGTPTLTFRSGESERMLPYHSFINGLFENGVIELTFQEFAVRIEGSELRLLWEPLQLQDVRWIRAMTTAAGRGPDAEACVVTSMVISKRE